MGAKSSSWVDVEQTVGNDGGISRANENGASTSAKSKSANEKSETDWVEGYVNTALNRSAEKVGPVSSQQPSLNAEVVKSDPPKAEPESESGSRALRTENERASPSVSRNDRSESNTRAGMNEGASSSKSGVKSVAEPTHQRERRVPSSSFERVLGFGQLGVGLALGAASESVKRLWKPKKENIGSSGASSGSGTSDGFGEANMPLASAVMTERNAERLAVALCRMRGAALKFGQMLSIQDETIVPPQITAALERVRQGADVMPSNQLHTMLISELGDNWKEKLKSFDETPLAAASIGQVHRAKLLNGEEVVMKVQYPGVADSIDSDINALMKLATYTDLLPKGLYAQDAARVAKDELREECNYLLEADNQEKFGKLLKDNPKVRVPKVILDLSSRRVLTSEFVPGFPVDQVVKKGVGQSERNDIATTILDITLKELWQFRLMQSDPNFANFLYDPESKILSLIDFGATREYPKPFVDEYLKMVVACADRDREALIESSIKLGFLTGDESKRMIDAHVEAGFEVGRPFASLTPFDFSKNADMTKRVTKQGQVMLKDRLRPPPREAYSLHRKLSGAFLMSMRIGANSVPCRALLQDLLKHYHFSDGSSLSGLKDPSVVL